MLTLCIRYTIDPNKLTDFRAYVEAEQDSIRRSGGKILGYFLPTDFAGPTNEAQGLIDFPNLANYEQYRRALAEDPDHKKNAADLERSGAIVVMKPFDHRACGRKRAPVISPTYFTALTVYGSAAVATPSIEPTTVPAVGS